MNEKILYYKELIEQHCKKNPYFTARAIFGIYRIPRKDIGCVAHAIKLLHKQGKIKKRGSKTWQWDGNGIENAK